MAMYNPNMQILGGQPAQSAASVAARQRLNSANDAQNQAYHKYLVDQFQPGGGNDAAVKQDLAAYQSATNDLTSSQGAGGGGPDPNAEARTQIQHQTTGFGDQIMDDPRITAALDHLNPTTAENNYYSQATDQSAASAASRGDMLRQQMQQSGIGINDPAYQAQLRDIATGTMQTNNAARATASQVGNAAASQAAQIRLGQVGQAAGEYNVGANYLANTQTGAGHVDAGYQQPGPYAMPPAGSSPFTTPAGAAPSLYQPNFDFASEQPPTAAGGGNGLQEDYGSGYLSNEIDQQNNTSAGWGEGGDFGGDPNAAAYMPDAAGAGAAYGASYGANPTSYGSPNRLNAQPQKAGGRAAPGAPRPALPGI